MAAAPSPHPRRTPAAPESRHAYDATLRLETETRDSEPSLKTRSKVLGWWLNKPPHVRSKGKKARISLVSAVAAVLTRYAGEGVNSEWLDRTIADELTQFHDGEPYPVPVIASARWVLEHLHDLDELERARLRKACEEMDDPGRLLGRLG